MKPDADGVSSPLPQRPPAPIIAAYAELHQRLQWVCWRKEHRHDKLTKVPYNPRTGGLARSDQPGTWASYELARHAYEQALTSRRPYDGLGYMFHHDYTGIDLDHCVQSEHRIDAWAQAYLNRLPSYAEYSPSGTGVHILVRGSIPRGMRRAITDAPHPQAAIEMYSERRYFTMSGQHVVGTPLTLEVCPELQTIHAELTQHARTPSKAAADGKQAGSAPPMQQEQGDTILNQAMRAKNGATFRSLWEGDTSRYGSQSEAELALCHLLAFWTNKDAVTMDRLFRQSALFRPDKWDRGARSGETYGQGTIARAIASCSNTYRSHKRGRGDHARPVQAVEEDQEQQQNSSVQLPAVNLEVVLECLQNEEEGDARLYARLFQNKCVYDHTEGMWYEWHGHVWVRDECKHALLLASGPLASVYLEASAQLSEEAAQMEKHLDPALLKGQDPQHGHYQWLKAMTGKLIERARSLKKLRRAQAVLTYAQAYLSVTARQWDCHIWLLACANGVLDLHTGELHPGRPEDYLRTSIPTEWCGLHASAPRWERFLQEVFEDRAPEPRTQLIAFLQRMLGYGITGAVQEHVFGVFYGEEGRNGKDTIQHALSVTLGELSSAISKDVLLDSGRMRSAGSATPHLCDLHGRRLAWASEPEKGARFSVGQVKELSGGGEIPVRGLYEKHLMKVKPTHLLLLLTNHKPYADPDDKAFWERLRLITFNMRFVTNPVGISERAKDPSLWKDLEAEASGILAWLIRGCLAWQQQGLASPEIILSEGEAYRNEQDQLAVFLTDCCLLHEHAVVSASSLFEAYTTWGKANNMRHLLSGTAFGTRISKRFKKKSTNRGNVYVGIGLLHDPQAALPLSPRELSEASDSHQGDEVTNGTPRHITSGGCGGLVEGCEGFESRPSTASQTAAGANGQEDVPSQSGGFEGLYTNFMNGEKEVPYKEVPVHTLHTLHFEEKGAAFRQPGMRADEEVEGWQNAPHNPPPTLHFVETADGPGYLSGNKQEQDVTFVDPERQGRLRYKVGVVLLLSGEERFYYPGMLSESQLEAIRIYEQFLNEIL